MAALSVMWAPAGAQSLSDPTRPPGSLQVVKTGESQPDAQLQSILISTDRRLAVINGETVRQGGKYLGATVLRIIEVAVVLRHPDREERLELLPGIKKQNRTHRTRIAPGSGAK
ncbi:MAG: MSHA biogenesis protein MshK [Proteobacteria bacterium]|nr:MSHA biogenesis protein MshK [Pseudomonadota bacterium]